MGLLWIALRILLLGYERIAGARISKGSPTLVAAWGFFFFSFLAFLPFLSTITVKVLLLSMASGSIYSASFSLYTYALAHEETSVVAPLYNLNSIFLVILSALMLRERLSISKVLGAVMMIYGVSFLKKGENLRRSYLNLLRSRGATAMLSSSLLMAFGRVVDRNLTLNIPPLDYAVGVYLVISLYLLVFGILRHHGARDYGQLVRQKFFHLVLGGVCNAYSYVALLNAFNYFEVSVAEPLSMLSVFVTMLFAKLILRERLGMRIVSGVIMLLGSFLIFRS